MPDNRPLPREAVLIVNTHSRRGEALFTEAHAKLKAAGVRIVEAHPVYNPGELIPTVRKAVQAGARMVIIGGGDGSLSSSIDELVGSDCVFAVLPLGTANSFARSLGIPLDLDGAVLTIATGRRRRIDLGVINGDYFANAAAIGLSPIIGETIPHTLKRSVGRLGYALWAIWCLFHFRPFKLSVDDGREKTVIWASEVRVFNGSFHGGVELIDENEIDDGLIVIQAVTGKTLRGLAWDWFARFFRLPGRHLTTREFKGTSLLIDTKPRLKISIDGEVLTQTPAVVESSHKAIDVAVPDDRQLIERR